MTIKRFTPERGQFFWYIKEAIIDGFPDLEIKGIKFDPKDKDHASLVENSNCYLTESDAFESLAE